MINLDNGIWINPQALGVLTAIPTPSSAPDIWFQGQQTGGSPDPPCVPGEMMPTGSWCMPQGDITGFAGVVVGAKPAKIDAQEIPANPGNALDCITLQIDRPSAHPDTVPIAVATSSDDMFFDAFIVFTIWMGVVGLIWPCAILWSRIVDGRRRRRQSSTP